MLETFPRFSEIFTDSPIFFSEFLGFLLKYLCNFIHIFREITISSPKKHWFSCIMQIQGISKKIRVNCQNVLIISLVLLAGFFRENIFFLKNAEFVKLPTGSEWENRRSEEGCYFECLNIGPEPRYSSITQIQQINSCNERQFNKRVLYGSFFYKSHGF